MMTPSQPEAPWPVYLTKRAVEPDDLELARQGYLLLTCKSAALAGVGRGPEAAEAVRRAVAGTEGLLRGGREVRAPLATPQPVWLRCPPAAPSSAWAFLGQELCQQEFEPCYLYDLACQLALASTLPDAAGLGDPAAQAVRALRDHLAFGFDGVHKLRADPALAPLRKRADFEQLARDLEARRRGKESS